MSFDTRLAWKIVRKELQSGLRSRYFAIRHGVKIFSDRRLLEHKKSDTLFVLGSGGSINMLTKDEWKEIGRCDSVGLNFWVLHDFVPTYYCFEEARDGDRRDIFYKTLASRVEEFRNTPFIAKDLQDAAISFDKIPYQLRDNIYLSVDFTVQIGGRDDLLQSYLKTLGRLGRLKHGRGLHCLYGITASISYLLFFALHAGYSRVVLCGVDLSDSKYFYEEDVEHYLKKGLKVPVSNQPTGVHSTARRTPTKVPITEVIHALDKDVLQPAGMELFVAKNYGALTAICPTYFADMPRP